MFANGFQAKTLNRTTVCCFELPLQMKNAVVVMYFSIVSIFLIENKMTYIDFWSLIYVDSRMQSLSVKIIDLILIAVNIKKMTNDLGEIF